MLSVRLPIPLEHQLALYCETLNVTKSAVVQQALEKHLKDQPLKPQRQAKKDPFLALLGSGNRKYSTEQIMRMTRGSDWNKP
jgi:hypothetical protein